jgi:cobalt-zinc-cadmium efflux system protein
MVIIAAGGLIVNIIGAWMLHKGSKENLNIKGAFLHVIGDLLGSAGAIIAGVLVWKWQFYIADPVVSVFIAILVLYSSINLTKSAVNILMEAAPKHVNIREIQDSIAGIKDVADVYDLHVWSISSNHLSLSVHVAAKIEDYEIMLYEINKMLKEKFGIEHSTIQIEPKDFRKAVCPFS